MQSNIGQTVSGSTITATYTNNTAGDISVAGVVWCSATGNAVTVSSGTDTAGNTYTVDTGSRSTITATHYADCNVEFIYSTSILYLYRDEHCLSHILRRAGSRFCRGAHPLGVDCWFL